jgi:hypothetical protein
MISGSSVSLFLDCREKCGVSIFDQQQLGLFSLGLFSTVTTAGAMDF